MDAEAPDLDSLSLYFGVPDMESALGRAVTVWNAFWGPLGEHEITKQTLVDNKNLVLAMVSAVGESLIQDKLAAQHRARETSQALIYLRNRELSLYVRLTKDHACRATEVRTNLDEMIESDTRAWDDSLRRVMPEAQRLRWIIEFADGKYDPLLISHLEYSTMFAHVRVE